MFPAKVKKNHLCRVTAGQITELTCVRLLLFLFFIIANSCLIASVLSCAFLFISNEPEYIQSCKM